jgi:DNA-binding transcriptional ArsR family regulator
VVIARLRREPHRAGELAEACNASAPGISRHLRVLRDAGLIEETTHEDDARVRLYQLRPEAFGRLRTWLDEVETFWAGQLDAFKDYAEKTRKGRRA